MIFILKRTRSLFFSSILLLLFLIGNIFENTNLIKHPFAIFLYLIIALIYFISFGKSYLIRNNYYSQAILLIMLFIFTPIEINYEFLIVNILISITYLLYLTHESNNKLTYFNLGMLLFITNYLYFPTFSLTIALLFYTFIYSKYFFNRLLQLFFGLFLSFITLIQLNFLLNFDLEFWNFLYTIDIHKLKFIPSYYFLIPILLLFILALFDTFTNIQSQSFLKKHESNKFIIFMIFSLLVSIFISIRPVDFFNLMLFPISIYLGRFIHYQKEWYIKEIIFILIVISLFLYKFWI